MDNREFKISVQLARALGQDSTLVVGSAGETLKAALIRSGIYFPHNCGGRGDCGHCRVEFLSTAPGMLRRETELLGKDSPYRLACLHKLRADMAIRLPEPQWFTDKTINGFEASASGIRGYGIAVDLGTTAVGLYLTNPNDGRIIAQHSFMNPQVNYGGDVMTRLELAKFKEPRAKLTQVIHQSTSENIAKLLATCDVTTPHVDQAIMVGNTAMIHLFLGLAGEGLEKAPFRSPLEGQGVLEFDPEWIGLGANCRCEICPVIQGFIGGDATAAILATDLDEKLGNRLLIDLGTNGEIVLSRNGNLWATSTAAGPAFEGVGLHDGIPARKGAIEGFSDGGEPFVIGAGRPSGFCGSGYVAALALLLRNGLLDSAGLMAKDEHGIRRWSPSSDSDGAPFMTQDDVRKFQYAKGAIAAGIKILLNEAGIRLDELDDIIITGSFGNRIDPKAAVEIGLIPDLPPDKVSFVDNAAGRGAILCLAGDDYKERARRVQNSVKVVNLGEHPSFQQVFIANMSFPKRLESEHSEGRP